MASGRMRTALFLVCGWASGLAALYAVMYGGSTPESVGAAGRVVPFIFAVLIVTGAAQVFCSTAAAVVLFGGRTPSAVAAFPGWGYVAMTFSAMYLALSPVRFLLSGGDWYGWDAPTSFAAFVFGINLLAGILRRALYGRVVEAAAAVMLGIPVELAILFLGFGSFVEAGRGVQPVPFMASSGALVIAGYVLYVVASGTYRADTCAAALHENAAGLAGCGSGGGTAADSTPDRLVEI